MGWIGGGSGRGGDLSIGGMSRGPCGRDSGEGRGPVEDSGRTLGGGIEGASVGGMSRGACGRDSGGGRGRVGGSGRTLGGGIEGASVGLGRLIVGLLEGILGLSN